MGAKASPPVTANKAPPPNAAAAPAEEEELRQSSPNHLVPGLYLVNCTQKK